MVHYRGSFYMSIAKLTWITSIIGQASNAVVVAAGSPQTFSSIKAELTSAVSDIFEAEEELINQTQKQITNTWRRCIDCDMPHLVREHLFIGNIGDVAEVLQNGSKEITHILSILSSASISFFSEWRSGLSIPTEEICKVYAGDSELEDVLGDSTKSSLSPEKLLYSLEYAGNDLKLVRMAVPLRDTENENLLDYLDVCLDFTDKSRKEGSVLVHCFAGVSRSAAIITAYLMRTKQLSQEDALESSEKVVNLFAPMMVFWNSLSRTLHIFFLPLQLKMFEEMGFKMLCPMMTGDSYNRGERIDTSKLGADPGLPTEEASSDVGTSGNSGRVSTAAYRCKKCRRVVALQENIVDHVLGEGETSFGWHKRKGGNPFNKCDEIECSSIFVEPLHWMTTVEEGALEGKLLCVHCEARLGYFNWSGFQCSCGNWITPAFQLHKSRVDISTV
ncbi:Dual specificity protein phosphatase 12 [Camellia lanceoleosa]|nr:Dual specificity protein phosphatase 12 [Camellia lanceoleosa]